VAPGAPTGPNLNPPANPNTNPIPGPPIGNVSSPSGPNMNPPTRPGSGPTLPPGTSRTGTPGMPPGGKPGAPVMAPIDRKVEVAPGAFIPTQAAQQANRAFYMMHTAFYTLNMASFPLDTRPFDDPLKAYKGAMQYDEAKYKPIYERINSFLDKINTASNRRKALSEIEETVLSEDPVPIRVKDYYVWQKGASGLQQQQQRRPGVPAPYTAMPPGQPRMPNSVMPPGQPRMPNSVMPPGKPSVPGR
jgi:hypothetical protein